MSNITEKFTEFENEINGIRMRASHVFVKNNDGNLTPMWIVSFKYEDDSYKNRLHNVNITPTEIKLCYKHCDDMVEKTIELSKYDECTVVFDDSAETAETVFKIAMGFYNLMQTIKTNALW